MSYSTDSYIQEDTCTFPVYQRLRKLNPYAYYSLDAQIPRSCEMSSTWRKLSG